MTLAAFLSIMAIHLAAVISPGPAFVVAVRIAVSEGFWTGSGVALGFGLGAATYAAAALAGVAVLFELVPGVFLALRLAGAAFLLFIAYKMWCHAGDALPDTEMQEARGWLAAVKLGFWTFMTNPKAAVFFGAVFVGLVPVDTPVSVLALLILTVALNESLWYLFVARVFSLPKARSGYIALKSHLDRVFGTFLALFGLKIALG